MTNFQRSFCILMRYALPEDEILAVSSIDELEAVLNGALEQMITDACTCTGVMWDGIIPTAALQACINRNFSVYDGFGDFT
jgi:hypothetical protein